MSNRKRAREGRRRSLKALLIFSIFVFLPSSYGYERCHSFWTCFQNGYYAFYDGDYDRTIYYYEQALKEWTTDDGYENFIGTKNILAEAYNSRGNEYYNKDEYDKAIKDYTKAIELNRNDAKVYYNRGNAYYNKGEYDRAIQDFNKAIGLNPNDANAYISLGNAYKGKGEYDKAIEDFNKAIALKPDYADAYFNRGNAYDDKGEYDKAIKDYDKAIALNPKLAPAYRNRGVAYDSKGEYDKAIEDYNKAIAIDSDNTIGYYRRGNAYYDKGEYDKAIKDYTKAIEIGFGDDKIKYAAAYFNRGLAYDHKGEYDKSIKDYTEAIELNRNFTYAYNNRGNAYFNLNQLQQAIKNFNKAIEVSKEDDAYPYGNLGEVYFILNDEERMKENYDKAIEIFKKHFKSLSDWDKQAYAYYLVMALKDLDEAEKIMRELGKKHKEDRDYLSTLAFVLYRKGKEEEAIKIYKDLEKTMPEAEKAFLYYHFAALYHQKYQSTQEDSYLAQARTYLEKSLSILPTYPFALKLYQEITGKPYR